MSAEPSHGLHWLPPPEDWRRRLDHLEHLSGEAAWNELVRLAGSRLDFLKTDRLERALRRQFDAAPPPSLETRPIRLAVLGSSTTSQLLPSIRIAALRRGLWTTIHEGAYGQYQQELAAGDGPLAAFAPDVVLLALDAHHLVAGIEAARSGEDSARLVDHLVRRLKTCWRSAQDRLKCSVIQQTALPIFPPVLGSNEHRLAASRSRMVARINERLREEADEAGIHLLGVDAFAALHGTDAWHSPSLWHRAKQEVSPVAAPFYGELVGRLLAAMQGRSAKCLVLDLDNTLWGGVIGEDGLDGIEIGNGSALGEAYLAVQSYVAEQARRGVILAVCSKNDAANAEAPFERHPEMLLKRRDFAAFEANWDDKAANIRRIAESLDIGLDSLVFVDDSAFERNLVRAALPMVAVPELPDDPTLYPRCLADAGYFEGLAVTDEDRQRQARYRSRAQSKIAEAQATDLSSYLSDLDMELRWGHLDRIDLARVTQLINKTNQFNLTTRRYTEQEVQALRSDEAATCLHFRLVDRFGDNGIISVVILRCLGADALVDTWLMSCRVLGRRVEDAVLSVVCAEMRDSGAARLIGEYRPTSKNGLVRDLYPRLGFAPADHEGRFVLDLATYVPGDYPIRLTKVCDDEGS